MLQVIVTTRTCEEITLEGYPEQVLMELIRDSGIDEIAAICGGCASCATCHVYVESAFLELLPRMSQQEDDLLYAAEVRTGNSRLSCQIRLSDNLDGLKLTIAPEE
jgi:2Fe-2S ferredoxin